MKNKKWLIALGAVSLLLVAGIVLTLTSDSSTPGGKQDPFRAPGGSGPGAGTTGDFKVSPTKILADYMKWAVYPPNSRPISQDNTDIVFPDIIDEPFKQMVVVDNGKVVKADYACHFQPGKHTLYEGDSLHISLTCIKGDGRGLYPGNLKAQPVKVRVLSYSLSKVTYKPKPTPLPKTFIKIVDDGTNGDKKAGDRRYTIAYTPTRKEWGDLLFEIKFDIPEEAERHKGRVYEHRTGFFASPVAPALFTGDVTETIKNGSLVLSPALNVKIAGTYEIYGNLRQGDTYVGVARKRLKLKKGLQRVPLLFFGKLFHDKNAEGAYVLESLRGHRITSMIDGDKLGGSKEAVDKYLKNMQEKMRKGTLPFRPRKQVIPTYQKTYSTRKYRLTDFSKEEWKSPKKDERIKMLKSFL